MTATDATLIELWISQRDAEAFNEIVSRHAGLVYGVSKRILRNDADAEDVAQDCFLRLARASSPPRASLAGWLHTVATRAALDCLRARARRRQRERSFAAAKLLEPSAPSWDEVQEHVDACIAELPGDLRDLVVAHFLERRTHEALATRLGVSRQTVTLRLAKAVERLRALLSRRGVVVHGGVLVAFFSGPGVEAAPPALLASLGRLALAGPALPSLIVVGGLVMTKKLLFSTALAAVLFLTSILAFRDLLDDLFDGERPAGAPAVAGEARSGGPAAASPAPVVPTPSAELERRPAAAASVGPTAMAARAASGRVLDAEGRPVRGAEVVAASGPLGRPEKLLESRSDEAGRFRLDLATSEDVLVYAFKTDSGLGVAAADSAPLEVVLEPLGAVSGRIYDRETGQGLSGLPVRLVRRDREDASELAVFHAGASSLFPEIHSGVRTASTGDEGLYSFADLGPFRYQLEFDPDSSEYVLPGYRREDALPEIHIGAGERRTGVDFALEPGGSIAGRVFGPDGTALSGARVDLLGSFTTDRPRGFRCDAEGAYRFSGVAVKVTYVVRAVHAGLPPGDSAPAAVAEARAIEGVDIHLERGHAARGRLVDDAGLPLAKVELGLWRDAVGARPRLPCGGAVTAADGSFTFEPVAAGRHTVGTGTREHLEATLPFEMPRGRDLDGLEVVLRRRASGAISGRVVNGSGEPVAGMPVTASLGMKPIQRAVSAEDGSFRLEGLGDAPSYLISAYSGEYWSDRRLEVPLDTAGLTVTVLRRGRVLGRAVDAENGKPVTHFEARAVFIRQDGNRFHLKWTPFDSEAGEFLFEAAEPVDCEVQVRAPDYLEARSSRFNVPEGGAAEGVVVSLGRGAALRGVALDAETGEPIEGARIRAHQVGAYFPWLLEEGKPSYADRGVWRLEMSRADGGFELGGLPLEPITLVVWKEGYGTLVRPGLVPSAGGEPLALSLSREAKVIIMARFQAQPGERYEFHAHHREAKPWAEAFRASASAGRPGTLELSGLPPGPYRLVVLAARGEGKTAVYELRGEERLSLTAGERRELPLDLEELESRFATLSGAVSGRPDLTGIRVLLASQDDPTELYSSGPAPLGPGGRFRFPGLPAGRYVVVASDPSTRPPLEVRVAVELVGGERRELDVPWAP